MAVPGPVGRVRRDAEGVRLEHVREWGAPVAAHVHRAPRLVLDHLAEPYDAGSTGPGWQHYLDRLGAVLAGGRVPDDGTAYAGLAAAFGVPEEET